MSAISAWSRTNASQVFRRSNDIHIPKRSISSGDASEGTEQARLALVKPEWLHHFAKFFTLPKCTQLRFHTYFGSKPRSYALSGQTSFTGGIRSADT